MKREITNEIASRIKAFYNSEPQHIEVEIAEGVHFTSDNTFEEDLWEPTMTCAVLIEEDSPHNKGEPVGRHQTLSNYSDFGDTIMADVIFSAVADAGGTFDEIIMEHSQTNNTMQMFLGSIPNERVSYDWEADEMQVTEEYAQ